jgi:hypothetical protein
MTGRPVHPLFIVLLQTAPLAAAGWQGTATVPWKPRSARKGNT